LTAYAISQQCWRNEHQAKVPEESSGEDGGEWWRIPCPYTNHRGQAAFKADMDLKTGGLMRMSVTVSEALLQGAKEFEIV
jgi:hypothetical protein